MLGFTWIGGTGVYALCLIDGSGLSVQTASVLEEAIRVAIRAILVAIPLSLMGCSAPDGAVFTLYRNSVTNGGENMRLHVATFDSVDGEAYNRENCDQAQILFQNQPGVKTKLWCEKGRFKK